MTSPPHHSTYVQEGSSALRSTAQAPLPPDDRDEGAGEGEAPAILAPLTHADAAVARAEAEKLKTSADTLFKKRLYTEAQSAYLDAISALPARSEHDEGDICNLRGILYANLSAAALGGKDWIQAREAATNALKDRPQYVKALHRRATACEQIGGLAELNEAKGDYDTLCSLPDEPPLVTPTAKAQWQASKQKVEQRAQVVLQEETERMKQMGLQALQDTANAFLNPFGWSTKDFGFEQQEGGGYSINVNRGGKR